ncbi:MAG: SUMF1/EgtB/PvdO family nonheme iron enzyme [Spirochaetaceae bacterium]|jgi:formylglycine-generating enzyme required for sulfatase activity|nr:SUMF1/EgtB/PvdO family nonheme iron enzyme [Spirochaetaceae bacterium]
MFGKKTVSEETNTEDQVRLVPILGIKPGIYLTVLYTLIILLILFFALVYPGLTKPGSLVTFSSEPSGAAVRVDGVTLGATPCGIFIPRGKRVIELVLPGFQSYRIEPEIPGRIFASALFPHKEFIRGKLQSENPAAALILAAADYAEWSFAGEPTAAFQIPLSLSEGAYRAGPAGTDPQTHEKFNEILKASLRFASTRAGLRDLLRAKFLIDNGGTPPSPVTILRSAEEALTYLTETPGAAAWLAAILPPEASDVLAESFWYQKDQERAAVLGPSVSLGAGGISGKTLEIGALSFQELPPGTLVQETPFPHAGTVEGFWIADTEVSAEAWDVFLAGEPEWRAENTQALVDQGLANADYLLPADNPSYPYPTVPGVSWYAAQAYCEWLTRFLPPALTSYEVRLPTEAEWEYAAKLSQWGALPLEMLGGLWEWCGDPFAPLSFLPAEGEIIRDINSPERPVKGGSWVSSPLTIDAETRASLPPSSCSPFVSFRPIIAPRDAP